MSEDWPEIFNLMVKCSLPSVFFEDYILATLEAKTESPGDTTR
jgi:hypothetical protein